MYKLFVLTYIFLFGANSLLTEGFDFEDKKIQKELLKITETATATWKEIVVPDSLDEYLPIQGKFLVLPEPNELKKYVYIGRVNSCRQGGCSSPVLSFNVETPEFFDYLIVWDANCSVSQVKVYNYQATHGQEITNKSWLKQFLGYNGNRSLTVGKSIDAISGATVSVHGITNDVKDKTRLLRLITSH
jgi:hypothetical protein